METYFVFAGNDYYPQGGASDLVEIIICDDAAPWRHSKIINLDDVIPGIHDDYDWAHIMSAATGKVIWGNDSAMKTYEDDHD